MKNEKIKEVIKMLQEIENDDDVAIIMEVYKRGGKSHTVINGEFDITCAAFSSLMQKIENSEDLQNILIMHASKLVTGMLMLLKL